jgi:UDP-N-acetylglucosamine 2-epimerase (non-hydrolysing)
LQILVAHVEAGLRSFDRTMPEEINRLLTDAISDYLFTPSPDADENLRREGIPEDKIFLVGNVMVDSLLFNLEKAKKSNILKELGLQKELSSDNHQLTTDYALLTLHRPSNVDDRESLHNILEALKRISKEIPIIFPIHPRTRKQVELFGFQYYFNNFNNSNYRLSTNSQGLHCIDSLGYLNFLRLMLHAKFIMTDSGGIQEETTVLDIPCLTLRGTTERPITIDQGTNILVGNDPDKIMKVALSVLENGISRKKIPKYWDGKTADRIIKILSNKQ